MGRGTGWNRPSSAPRSRGTARLVPVQGIAHHRLRGGRHHRGEAQPRASRPSPTNKITGETVRRRLQRHAEGVLRRVWKPPTTRRWSRWKRWAQLCDEKFGDVSPNFGKLRGRAGRSAADRPHPAEEEAGEGAGRAGARRGAGLEEAAEPAEDSCGGGAGGRQQAASYGRGGARARARRGA